MRIGWASMWSGRGDCRIVAVLSLTLSALHGGVAAGADPWADAVVSYQAGTTADPGYPIPANAVGAPERFTGETSPYGSFPSVVSIFNPAFGSDEIVSLGEGGHLTLRFDEPIVDDPAHEFGVDMIVFGNIGFWDGAYPTGQQRSPALSLGADRFNVEVSADGVTYLPLSVRADRLFPAQGWLDSGPYDVVPGTRPTNFLKPVNPALTLSDFNGLSYAQCMALYDGSGGGIPLDLSVTGLASASYVRFSVPDDGNPNVSLTAEIDAVAAVPEPTTLVLLTVAAASSGRGLRRLRRKGGRS